MSKRTPEEPEREERILMNIVVDAYGPEEQRVGWHCHLEGRLPFPFEAICAAPHRHSPLSVGQVVTVIGMSDIDDCEGGMRVDIEYESDADEDGESDELSIPLEQLDFVGRAAVDGEARNALDDWRYWRDRGYRFG